MIQRGLRFRKIVQKLLVGRAETEAGPSESAGRRRISRDDKRECVQCRHGNDMGAVDIRARPCRYRNRQAAAQPMSRRRDGNEP